MKTEFLKQVSEFHTTFKHPILDTPTIPKKRMDMRIALIQEELDELQEACLDDNIVEVADALADLQYVLAGAILEFGLGDKFLEIFNEVHRSNMSKACKHEKEAIETVANYATKGVSTNFKKDEESGLYLVYRTSDNKVLKSINYSPANIKSIIEK